MGAWHCGKFLSQIHDVHDLFWNVDLQNVFICLLIFDYARLMIDRANRCLAVILYTQDSFCLTFSGFCVLTDVEAVEARCSSLRVAWGWCSCGRSAKPPANGGPDGPQHLMDPWSPTAEPRPAHLPHDPCCSSCVRLFRVDGSRPHLPPGQRCLKTPGRVRDT